MFVRSKPFIISAVAVVIVVAVIALVPQLTSGLLLCKGNAELSLGFNEAALNDFETVLKIDPNSAEAMMNAACLLDDAGESTRAELYFNKLYMLPSMQLRAAAHLTALSLRDKDYRAALNYAQTWTSLAPKESRAYHAKGMALVRLGREQDALASLDESIKLDPHSEAALDRDQIVTKYKSLEDVAAKVMDPQFENKPDNFDSLVRDAQRLFVTEDFAAAVDRLTTAIKLKPAASAYGMRAAVYFNWNHYKEAAADFARVETLGGNKTIQLLAAIPEYKLFANSNNIPASLTPWDTRYYHGVALIKIGDYNGALKCLNKVISMRSDYAPAYMSRADVYQHLNNDKQATLDRAKAKTISAKAAPSVVQETLEKAIY